MQEDVKNFLFLTLVSALLSEFMKYSNLSETQDYTMGKSSPSLLKYTEHSPTKFKQFYIPLNSIG